MSSLLLACQAVIIVTFAVSSGSKLRSRSAFGDFRDSLPLTIGIPRRLAWLAATVVVAAEVTVALALTTATARPGVALAGWTLSVLLLAIFTTELASMIRRGIRQPCLCFGHTDRPPGVLQLIRNGILLTFATGGAGIIMLRAPEPPDWQSRSVLAVAAGVVAALLLINLEDLVALTKPVPPSGRCAGSG